MLLHITLQGFQQRGWAEGKLTGCEDDFVPLAWVVNRWIGNCLDCFLNTYPLESDLYGGYCYPAFKQLRLGLIIQSKVFLIRLPACENQLLCC